MLRLKKIMVLLPLLLVFMEYQLFMPFVSNEGTGVTPYENYTYIFVEKIIPLIGLFFSVLFFYRLNRGFRFLFIFPIVYFIYLVFESLFLYNSFFQFPHVFLKIFSLFVVLSIYLFYVKFDQVDLKLLFYIIIAVLLINVILNPSIISITAFINHKRGLSSESVFLLLLPCLYFLNSYLTESNKLSLICFLLLSVAILFFQHRTIWVASCAAFIINVIFVSRQKSIDFKKILPGIFVVIIFVTFVFSLLLTYSGNFTEKLGENINEIVNPKEDKGTSGWRIRQMEAYWPFVKEHLVEGMRLKGFDLPVQFYTMGTDQQTFEDGTGHHFHSFYFDLLFYFGLIGVSIFLLFIVYPILLVLRRFKSFNNIELSFLSFVFSGLIYGIAYNLPFYFWAILGLFYSIVENKIKKAEALKKIHSNDNSISQYCESKDLTPVTHIWGR